MKLKALINQDKLDFFLQNNQNVLIEGGHGVGKTAVVKQVFDRAKLKAKYFSGATLDPWVDFIGVPRPVIDTSTGQTVLDLIRPVEFQNDEIEAIFVDEFNRTPKKVRNALMELMQFKTINGRPFKKLRVVWAAINPDDEEKYDVESIDPAQKDRFHIHIVVPYKPCPVYFSIKHPEVAAAAIDWWGELPEEAKELISPRRLDYALDLYKIGGDLRDIIPHSCNISKLLTAFTEGPMRKRLETMYENLDAKEAKKFFLNENNYASASSYVIKNDLWREAFLPFFPLEKLSSLASTEDLALAKMVEKVRAVPDFKEILVQKFKMGNQKLEEKIINLVDHYHGVDKNLVIRLLKGTHINPKGWIDELQSTKNATERVQLFNDFKKTIVAGNSFDVTAHGLMFVLTLIKFSSPVTIKSFDGLAETINLILKNFEAVGNPISSIIKADIAFTPALEKLKEHKEIFDALLPEVQKAI